MSVEVPHQDRPWRIEEAAESVQVVNAHGWPLFYIYVDDIPANANIRRRMSRAAARALARGLVERAGLAPRTADPEATA